MAQIAMSLGYPLGNRVVGSSVTVGGGFVAGCALLSVGWKVVGFSPIVTLLLTNTLARDLFFLYAKIVFWGKHVI